MDFAAGPPSKWLLTMIDSAAIEIWADGYDAGIGHFVFSILVDATDDERRGLEVTGRTPSGPGRVIITVARVPIALVVGVPMSA